MRCFTYEGAGCSAEFTHAMALNGKHASMLRGQQRVNQRYLKRNMSSVRSPPLTPQTSITSWPLLLCRPIVQHGLGSQALHAPSQSCWREDMDLPEI